ASPLSTWVASGAGPAPGSVAGGAGWSPSRGSVRSPGVGSVMAQFLVAGKWERGVIDRFALAPFSLRLPPPVGMGRAPPSLSPPPTLPLFGGWAPRAGPRPGRGVPVGGWGPGGRPGGGGRKPPQHRPLGAGRGGVARSPRHNRQDARARLVISTIPHPRA